MLHALLHACLQAAKAIAFVPTAQASCMLGTILVIVLVLLLLGALPTWPYSRGWGFWPGGLLGAILVIVLVLLLLGHL